MLRKKMIFYLFEVSLDWAGREGFQEVSPISSAQEPVVENNDNPPVRFGSNQATKTLPQR